MNTCYTCSKPTSSLVTNHDRHKRSPTGRWSHCLSSCNNEVIEPVTIQIKNPKSKTQKTKMKTSINNRGDLHRPNRFWCATFAGLALAASMGSSQAATLLIDSFDNATQDTGSWYFQNWNGSTAAIAFSSNDANGSGSSGSIKLSTDFDPSAKNGGAYRFSTSHDIVSPTAYTAIEYDVKVDPASPLDKYGIALDLKLGFSDSGYGLHNTDLNISPVTTNGGWQHVVIPISSVSGPGPQPIPEVVAQVYDNNYTNAQTAVIYIDNIKFTAPDPTYPGFLALTFDNTTNVVTAGTTGWYGRSINTYEWTTNDAAGSPTSGSLHIVADFTAGDNSCVVAIPFDPLYPGFSSPTPDTNVVINAQQMASVEMDILWDTNNSTVGINDFNTVGDINGFPVGLLYNAPGAGSGGQAEACGASTTVLPNAASNGWVHVSFPINQATANIDQCIGLWFKKYQWNGALSGTVGFYIDNVHFTGAAIPQSGPPLTLSRPVYGLQQGHSTGGYKREGLVTANASYTFVNQPNMTYAMNIASMPTDGGMSANFMFVPLQVPTVDGTSAEPNWTYPNILCAIIQRSGSGSSLTLAAKINQANDNGSLYNGPANLVPGDTDLSVHPVFNTASPITGNWSLKFTANNAILVTAPDGSFTNLTFPGVYLIDTNGLTSSEVAANFDFGANMVVYFNSQNGGSATASRVVLGGATISQGATTLLTDNFATNTVLDTPAKWLLASDGGATVGTFLLDQNIKWYLDWPITFNGYSVQINSNLNASGAWNTNATVSGALGAVYHADIYSTNLPTGGNTFFRLKKY